MIKKQELLNEELKDIFLLIMNKISDGLIILSITGEVLLANKEIARMLEINSVDEVIGKNIKKFMHKGFIKEVIADLLKVKKVGDELVTNYKIKTEKGNTIWIEVLGNVVKFKKKIAALGIVEDVTEEKEGKKAKEELKKSEKRLQENIESMMEGYQTIGYDWKYLYVNKAVAEHGKTTREKLIGRTMMECYPGIEKTEMFSHLKECMKKRKSYDFDNEFEYPDGSKSWFRLHMEPVPEGVLILSEDITERKKAEEKLKERVKELERFQKLTINREIKMIELKKRITELENKFKENKDK